ncbi:probable polygalacturonase At3g15720 [Macadamia integrifolia]|uniref:probable polygalacturonase At3g15720 n=1 Tax=Macadamia integrifolia TaxID=60698 RepID=UPI001C5341AC|nr:probable polygalacturonase At3g15720 [Macadamia integrifolia]
MVVGFSIVILVLVGSLICFIAAVRKPSTQRVSTTMIASDAAAMADAIALMWVEEENELETKVKKMNEMQVECEMQISGKLTAPSDISEWKDSDTDNWIRFGSINGLTITGSGPARLDGRGSYWWDCKNNEKCSSVPNTLFFDNIIGLSVTGLKFIDSPNINFVIQDSSWVYVSQLIGSLGDPGEYSKAVVEEIHVSNCEFIGTMNGARTKTWQGGSGFAREITFENQTMSSVDNPIVIDQYYCNGKTDCKNQTSAVEVSKVLLRGIKGNSTREVTIELACSETVPCTGIYLKDIDLRRTDPRYKTTSYCDSVHGNAISVEPFVQCLA